jgi:non-specific serine/threonine protein kinase
MDWSYDLLTEPEKRLLRRLSVFMGGWTMDAAEGVCAFAGIEAGAVLDLLMRLVDRSLVEFAEATGRYRLLETVRQYGLERLRESGEGDALRRRHADFYRALAEEAESKLQGPEQAEWLDRLETEHGNFRTALNGCREDPDSAETGLRLAGALWRFWEARGHLREGSACLAAALSPVDAARPTPPLARAKALGGAGTLAWQQGDYAAARVLLEESLALWREAGDERGIAAALHNLGLVAGASQDILTARALHEEGLAIARALGDRSGIAYALNNLGNVVSKQYVAI